MKRIYQTVIDEHFHEYEQMAFLSGPRQVGKTTVAQSYKKENSYFSYLNWDKLADREKILEGGHTIAKELSIDAVLPEKPILILDEIHKYAKWKNFLKGFIDEYKGKLHILVTGSAKLDVFRRGGDSLMGRYFLYRAHPLSVAEMLRTSIPKTIGLFPQKISKDQFDALFKFGGFPEPLVKADPRFYNRWQNLKMQQMLKEDIRSLAQIQELSQLEVLAFLLQHQASQLVSYTSLANKVRVSDQTIRRWINVLESFYYCFTIRPWSKNVSRSLLKEPKIYLWDWSVLPNISAKIENFVACHLLKAVHFWTDMGFGKYELYFLRDKDQHEVDFLIVANRKPWMMVEVKTSGKESLNKSLLTFQSQIQAEHVLQVAFDLPYVEVDCLALKTPKIVPMRTFLSQLI